MTAPCSIQLSFCIPTYNFGAFIGQTLDSIIQQADDRIEIVIIDGGSTDNTVAVVEEKRRGFKNIRFVQRTVRTGVDEDILESVAQAQGEYCWLFSSDDILSPGAIEHFRREAALEWDVYLTNFTLCDFHLNPIGLHKILRSQDTATFDWNNPESRETYFRSAETSTAFFSFISGVIVKREVWNRPGRQADFIGSCWIIAAQLFAASKSGLRVRYHPGSLLLKRGDNDSFSSRGLNSRFELAAVGFPRVAEWAWGPGSFEHAQVRRCVRNEYPLGAVVLMKLDIAAREPAEELIRFKSLVSRLYNDLSPRCVVARAVVELPAPLLKWMLSIYRAGKRLVARPHSPR